MTRNKKIVIPNITYSQSAKSGLTMTNLEVAKKALSKLNNPKLSNLEKAKLALKKINHPIFSVKKDYMSGLGYKVTVDSAKEEDKLTAKVMEQLMEKIWNDKMFGYYNKNYDKNTNRNKSASS